MAQRIPLPWELDNTEDVRDWRRIDPEVQRQRDREAAYIRSTETDNPELAGIEDRVAEVGGQKRKKFDHVDNPLRAEAGPAARVPLPWETPAKPTNKYSKYHLPLSTDIPKERGFLDEFTTQLAGGAMVDLPEMAGQGLKFLERETGLETGDLGRRIVAGARERAPQYERSGQERGFTADVLLSGARAAAPVLTAAPLALVPGGGLAAALAAGTLFGTSSAQETYDKLIAQGVSPEEATAASRRVGLIQGAGETIATAVGAKAFKPLLKGKNTSGLVADLTDTRILNPFAKGMAVNMLVQPTTEVAQDVGASLVERAYGGKAEDLYAIGKESFKGGLGLTLLLGPLSIGGHVSRSNNAATLKAALSDDLSVPPEVKQQAITAVQTAAQQKGIKEEDIADWVTKQIELEDRRNDALRRIEDAIAYDVEIGDPKTLEEYDKAFNSPSGEKITEVGADGKKKTRELTIGELIQEQAKRNILGELTEEPTNLLTPSVMNAQEYLEKMRRENILGSTDPLTQVETGKQVAPGVTQTASGTYVTAPEDQAPQGLGREMPKTAYGVPGVTTTGGGVYQVNPDQLQGPAAQVQTGQRVAEPQVMGGLTRPIAPVVSSSGQAAVSPSVTTPPGSFTPPVVATPTPAPKPAPKPKVAKVVVPVVAPAAIVETEDEEVARTPEEQKADDEATAKLIEEVGLADFAGKNPLQSVVQGEKSIPVPGRPSLALATLQGIRDALLRKSGKVSKDLGKKEQKIATALQNFSTAYDQYLNKGGNLVVEKTDRAAAAKLPEGTTPAAAVKATEERAATRIAGLDKYATAARNALAELGTAVGNNPKDVEVLVRLLKDTVQQKLAKPGKTKAETLKKLKKLDTTISSGWAAAKRDLFRAEGTDLADVRGGEVRLATEQQEKKGAVSPIEKAATEGFSNPTGKGETTYTGIAGVLQYLRFTGTPFERNLARLIRDSIEGSTNAPKLEFITTGNSRFDPVKNTVYLHKNESPEVILHEAMHSALQWYVHSNPNDPVVKQLKKSLKTVVGYKGTLTGKAAEVQTILKDLVAGKNELDAVLELISYGTTLNEFRKALQTMPTKGVPKTFYEAANSIWRMTMAIVRKLLGVNNTVASDVLASSLKLLEQASKKAPPEVRTGNVLEAAVTSNKAMSQAAGIPAQDFMPFSKRIAPAALSTRFLFDAFGWSKLANKIIDNSGKIAAKIRKDFPATERALIYINSKFSAGEATSQEIENFKVNKSVGYQQMERLANFVVNRSGSDVLSLFKYMDGDKTALDNVTNKEILTRAADNVLNWFDTYVKELPAADQKFFTNQKFSKSLLFASNRSQVASNTFGMRGLAKVMGLQHKYEETLDGFKQWIAKDQNGDLDLEGRFYQVFKNDPLIANTPQIEGYMSISEFEKLGRKNPTGYVVDPTREWWLSQYEADKKYKFTSSMTAKQAIDEGKADELANAMRNTMAALANNYASKNFSRATAAIGYTEDGKPTASSVAFNNLADIKEVFGRVVRDDQVLEISSNEARTPQITSMYRRTGTWVKLSGNKEVYGDLAGKYVSGPVWSAITDMSDRQPVIPFAAYNNGMRWFKKAKTVYNPGTHITNVASNVTLAMMHDIPMATLGKAARVFALYEVAPSKLTKSELDMMSSFMNSGAMLGDFSSAEVKRALNEAWAKNMAMDNDVSLMQRLASFTNYEKSKTQALVQAATKLGKKSDHFASEAYAAEDNIFRLAAFLTKAGDLQRLDNTKTATPEQLRAAGDFARKAFLDYDIDSKAVRVLRQSVIPFISWGYAVAPVLGRIALHQPWKIANIMMAYYLLDVGMAAMAGDDDEETRKALPESVRERMFFGSFGPNMHIRIPFMGDADNPVYYKLGDYVPFASMTKGLPNGLFGQSWIPSIVTPSGPMVSAVAGFIAGIDPYTGKSLHKPTDTEWDKLVNNAKFGYDIVAPPMVTSKNLTKATEIISGDNLSITGAEPSNAVFARMMGLKLYDYNVPEELARQDKIEKAIERDFKAAMNKAKKEEDKRGYPDYEELDETLEDLQTRMEERVARLRGEEEED